MRTASRKSGAAAEWIINIDLPVAQLLAYMKLRKSRKTVRTQVKVKVKVKVKDN